MPPIVSAGATHEDSSKTFTYRITECLGSGILLCHGDDRPGRHHTLAVGRTRGCAQGIVGSLVRDYCHCSCGSASCSSNQIKYHFRPDGMEGRLAKTSTREALVQGFTPAATEEA